VNGRDSRASRIAAAGVGLLVFFVVAVHLIRWIRPLPLMDPEPSWALARCLLVLLVVVLTVGAAGLAAGGFLLCSRSWLANAAPTPLPLSRRTLMLLAAGALATGTVLRFAALERLPASLWVDDLTLIAPALELQALPSDFADAIRPAPFGVAKSYGSVGVLYLEAYGAVLRLFGTNVFGVRFLSAAAGVCSIATAMLLGRALLPAGGGTLAALILAGLRWNLLLSRWGWVAIALAPVVDLAALLLLAARRRRRLALALLAGVVAGVGAHIYLAAWVAGAALALLAVWPGDRPESPRERAARALAYGIGFVLAVAPLFLFHAGREAPYFARASDHNVVREIRWARSAMPLAAAAADALAAPWFKADPAPHHDLAGHARLGWILGVPVAVALAYSLVRPRRESSAFFLTQAISALAASIAGGEAGLPNGFRFAYLGGVTAVAGAAGALLLLSLVPPARRREAAIAALGLLALSGAFAARDALIRWPQSMRTFDGFHGQDTLIARAMLRWERYGAASFDSGIASSELAVEAVRSYRLDPDAPPAAALAGSSRRVFRVHARGASPRAEERVVERVRDTWGREWAVVLGARRSDSEAAIPSGAGGPALTAAGSALRDRAPEDVRRDLELGAADLQKPRLVPDPHGSQRRTVDVQRDRSTLRDQAVKHRRTGLAEISLRTHARVAELRLAGGSREALLQE
jgi:dolichyl-phosphate-mannose-protein mannosyltransferase